VSIGLRLRSDGDEEQEHLLERYRWAVEEYSYRVSFLARSRGNVSREIYLRMTEWTSSARQNVEAIRGALKRNRQSHDWLVLVMGARAVK
jgi:hypothetical protein